MNEKIRAAMARHATTTESFGAQVQSAVECLRKDSEMLQTGPDTDDESIRISRDNVVLLEQAVIELLNAVSIIESLDRQFGRDIDMDEEINGGEAVEFIVDLVTKRVRPLLGRMAGSSRLSNRIVVEIRGGLVAAVYAAYPAASVIIRDFDNIAAGDEDPAEEDPGLYDGLTESF